MAKTFGATSTTDEVLEGMDLSGKRALVTGASAGLGVETAGALAAHGPEVVGAARDLAKAEAATASVRANAANGGGSLELVQLDLASLASVRACADRLIDEGRGFDLVIANAGVMATPFGRTSDRFEMQFGTNHLGHFVLVNRMASLMKPGARLVNLSSAGHQVSDVDLDDPNFERAPYKAWDAYGRSKTANILFAVEFDRRHKASGLSATAVHPGAIRTELSRYLDEEAQRELTEIMTQVAKLPGAKPIEYKSVPAGRGDIGLGRGGRRGRCGRRTVLRGLPRRRGRGCSRLHVLGRAPLCAQSRAREGAVGEERRVGRRALRLKRPARFAKNFRSPMLVVE